MAKKYTTDEFILKAKEVHGDIFIYDKVNYNGALSKITVGCKEHGYYDEWPNHHLAGKICPVCSVNAGIIKRRYSQEDYLSIVNKVHSHKYDYSKTDYKTLKSYITVTCVKHGDFRVTANNHKQGVGCKYCRYNDVGDRFRSNLKETISRCKEIHGDLYDYSHIELYEGVFDKIILNCAIHGNFSISWAHHKQGSICPRCSPSGYNQSKPGYIYILRSDNITKIGITNRDIEVRLKEINKSSTKGFIPYAYYYFENGEIPYQLEQATLQYLASQYQVVNETFDGSTECFLDVKLDELINFITITKTNL